jgi:hypothetical protein
MDSQQLFLQDKVPNMNSSDPRKADIPDVLQEASKEKTPFPKKMHVMLDAAEVESFTSTVSWLPDQKSFKVHDADDFVGRIMPRYFKQTKFKSFQRQINMWGFERILNGPGKGGYTHACFIRGQPSLCKQMKRTKVKGIRQRSVSQIPSTAKSFASSLDILKTEPAFQQILKDLALLGDKKKSDVKPKDGDAVMFEGRQFFFVDDYNPDNHTRAIFV